MIGQRGEDKNVIEERKRNICLIIIIKNPFNFFTQKLSFNKNVRSFRNDFLRQQNKLYFHYIEIFTHIS